MKKEILDFRFFLTVVLVVLSLSGQHLRYTGQTEAQNLSFVRNNTKLVAHISGSIEPGLRYTFTSTMLK
jgi:hypothetical protein